MATLKDSNNDGLAGMSGMTAYNRVDGEFYLHQMPLPDEQVVKQTIQGVVDEFLYNSDELSLQSIMKQNEPVKVTENAYVGETKSVYNKCKTSFSIDSSGNPFNRIIIQGGAGSHDTTLATNLSASVHDEIVAIGIEDVKPFLIKGLDFDFTADIKDGKPTNDGYIKHLTPSDRHMIASIEAPAILTSAGGPSKILVYYSAIDLTGEVVAGTGLTPSEVNARIRPYHVESNKPYLVVEKTVPSGSTLFNISGTFRSLSDILLKPYTSAPGTASDVQMEMVSPGGIIEIPTQDFKRPIKSHLLKSHGFDGSFPSPFVNIEDCVLTIKNGGRGYGIPKRINNTNTPDPTANPSHHILTISSNTGDNLKTFDEGKRTPSALRRSTLQVFNILDNQIDQNHHFILVAPANKNRYAGLEDFLSSSESTDPPNVSIEIALLNGRAEEFNTLMDSDGATLEIRGRSNLMDVTDSEVKRNLNLGETVPIKEIGDLGTPSVSMTLGGVGQGGVDAKSERTEHNSLSGWKDKVVSSGNVSVRNDRQTSTDYASTRALVEFPLFESMFYDTKGLYEEIDGVTNGVHAFGKEFEIEIDCTMTAMNRVQMQTYEARNSVDWGLNHGYAGIQVNNAAALGKTNRPYSFGLKVIHPKIQAVVESGSVLMTGASNAYIQVDSVEAFVNDTLQGTDGINRDTSTGVLGRNFYVIIGEGQATVTPTGPTGMDNSFQDYLMARVHKIDTVNNRLHIDQALFRTPRLDTAVNFSASSPAAVTHTVKGMSVVMGGVIVNDLSTHTGYGGSTIMNVDWGNSATFASQLRTALSLCLGMNTTLLYQGTEGEIRHNLGMGCLEWDIFNEWSQPNNRQLKEPIECKSILYGLKGISKDGTSLIDVKPQTINLRRIALKADGFESCVNEFIRKINMAGHPDAQEITVFDPFGTGGKERAPSDAYNSHLGYVRAFLGSPVVSRTGEQGLSVVIHSTVPGAAGRNFAVKFHNNSYYPYQPYQAFGHGGLLATNSRSYQLNSFPAPLPLGADGETYAPITTFTGAVHGPLTHATDQSNTQRTYNGIGQRMKTQTKIGAVAPVFPHTSYLWNAVQQRFDYIIVKADGVDQLMRSTHKSGGIIRVNGRFASYEDFRIEYSADAYNIDEMYLINVKPYKEADKFSEGFFQAGTPGTGVAVNDLEIEFIYPMIDTEGILFFGGGHTGVVFDISDGSKNDYSDFYKHHLANGPTGFAGFQNLGNFGTASAILDFTDVLNDDTVNDDTLRGFHHQTVFNVNNEPEGKCAFYARLSNGIYGSDEDLASGAALSQDNTKWREDLYNRKLRVTSANGFGTLAGSATSGTEVTPTGSAITTKMWHFGDVVALFNNNSGTVEAEHGEVKNFNPRGQAWCVSAVIHAAGTPNYPTGPIFHGIYNDGGTARPYGVHLGASAPSGSPLRYPLSLAITNPNEFPIGNQVQVSVLAPSTVTGGTVVANVSGFLFIMAGIDETGLPFLYMGHTSGITNPNTGAVEVGIFDYTPYMIRGFDEHYDAGSASPNKKAFFDVEATGYAGGDPDHPNVPTALQTIRDLDMATIGCALIGAPFVDFPPSVTTLSGIPLGTPITDYFTALQTGSPTYGVTGTGGSFGDGKNSAGPIHFAGSLSEVALWKRFLTFAEAQTWFDARNVW